MSLDKANLNLKLDSRMLEYNLRVGNITKEEYQKHLSQLPDVSSNSEKINLDEAGVQEAATEAH